MRPSPCPHPLHPLTSDAGPAMSSPAVGHRPWTWRTRGLGRTCGAGSGAVCQPDLIPHPACPKLPGTGLCSHSRNRFSSLGLPFLQPGLKWLPDVRLTEFLPRAAQSLPRRQRPTSLSCLSLLPPSIPGSRPRKRKRKQEASQGHYTKPPCRGRDPAGNRRRALVFANLLEGGPSGTTLETAAGHCPVGLFVL